MIYNFLKPYTLKLSRDALHVCFGDGNPADFYKFYDVHLVKVPHKLEDNSGKSRRRFHGSGKESLKMKIVDFK